MFEVDVYNPTHGYDKDYVESTHLIPIGNRYSSDDYMKAKYQGVDFERSDVCMQNVQSTGKSTTIVTYFQGSWNTFTFNKNVSTFLVIKEKEFLYDDKRNQVKAVENTAHGFCPIGGWNHRFM